ncbi:MAG TPA: MBL fold metallo-hydrolase [Candidatus Saccharimonadales bacterium]|nr:MBL fold metallo-hydrolase [Candidatus Saccharimonadales bacterium]
MQWTCWGAAREVTGSCHLLEVGGQRLLVDCGLFQGRRAEAWAKNVRLPFDPRTLDAVLVGHAHADHAGNLPTLSRHGLHARVHCTHATRDLCDVMLQDSAHLQQKDSEFLRKRGHFAPYVEPLYTVEDAQEVLGRLTGRDYGQAFQPLPDVNATLTDAGHILGSALARLELREGGRSCSVVYACDVGRTGLPILKDPVPPGEADVLVLESTYGDRLHHPIAHAEEELGATLERAAARGAKVVVPAFSLGRTQELLYSMHRLADAGRMPRVPVYLDSPLSTSVTRIVHAHPECFDEDMTQHMRVHPDPLGLASLHTVASVEDSKKLNDLPGPMVIVSASGMCEGGRVLHHLRNTIEDPRNMVLVVGYMAENTLGRRIAERSPEVKIYGEMLPLRAEVVILDAYSAHGDQDDLLRLASQIRPRRIYLVHGEPLAQAALEAKLRAAGFPKVFTPARGESLQL